MEMQGSGKRRRLRSGIGACIVLAMLASLGLVVASGLGSEHAATQNIEITLSKGTTTVSGADTLVAGLTKVTARNTGRAPTDFILVRLRPGKTVADLEAATNRSKALPEDVLATITSFFGLAQGRASSPPSTWRPATT